MLKHIKQNWLTAVISTVVGSIITLVIVYHWYSKNISDVITSWIVALSTLALAVFAWLAYRYAIDGYKKQAKINEITKAQINHLINIITKISSTLGSVQELFIEARGKNKIAMETAYNNFDEIITSTVEQNKLINIMNVKLNSSINKIAGLQIETFIYSYTKYEA